MLISHESDYCVYVGHLRRQLHERYRLIGKVYLLCVHL
jgi:hypothetical protein